MVVKQNPSMDTMVIDAIEHIAMCIADSISDVPEQEREAKRIEIVKTFAEGLLIKAKKAENRHKTPAKESINMYMAYVKPAKSDKREEIFLNGVIVKEESDKPKDTTEDDIRKFQEARVAYEAARLR